MTDDQIKTSIGVEETMQMLQFREQLKGQMTPELYEQNMTTHKATVRVVMDNVPGLSPIEVATRIVDLLDNDRQLDDDQREMWKALVVVAAFEMQEF